jgi:ribose transport system ATP-binding protein
VRAVGGPAVATPDRVQDLTGRLVRDVSMDLRSGEVVGLAGLPGSGHDEVPYLLFGARHGSGRLCLDGREHDVAAMSPGYALRAGIGLLPADRLGEGAVATLPVADNVMLPSLVLARRGRRAQRRLLAGAERLLVRHGVEPPDPRLPFGALSGGNQQKALLAKWLNQRPALLLLDEPLRGVDIGARERLTAMIRGAARDGARVVCASSDPEQLGALCDRALVFRRGRIAAILTGSDVEGRRIAALCHAGGQAASP